MNRVRSPVAHAGHRAKVGWCRLRDRTNASELSHQGTSVGKRDEGNRTKHRDLDAISSTRGSAVRWRDPHALSICPGERDRADPQCRVFGSARPDHGNPAVSQRDEHATHSARRERPSVEILTFHHNDRVRGGGTKPIQLLPEPAGSDGGVKIANCLPFDCSLRPYDVVPSPKRLEADRDPEPPERRGNTTRDLTMVDRHEERRKGTHHHEHARCGRPVLVAMRSMATKAVEAEPTW